MNFPNYSSSDMSSPSLPEEGKEIHKIDYQELSDSVSASAPLPLLNNPHPLHHVKTQVQVHVGKANLTIGQLLNAEEGQVIVLDRNLSQAVDLLIDGKIIARGHLVALDGRFAVRISELPQSLNLTQRSPI